MPVPMWMLAQSAFSPYSIFDCAALVLGLGILLVMVLALRSQNVEAVSHWYQLIDGLQYSTTDFYAEMEREIAEWNMPSALVHEVEHPEGHPIFSSKRRYFRVRRDDLMFDICGAQFGRGFFVSWWLVDPPGCLARLACIPVLGIPFRLFLPRLTYYRIDTQLMFQDAVHSAVLRVLDDLIKVNNLKELTGEQRKPIMKEFFKR